MATCLHAFQKIQEYARKEVNTMRIAPIIVMSIVLLAGCVGIALAVNETRTETTIQTTFYSKYGTAVRGTSVSTITTTSDGVTTTTIQESSSSFHNGHLRVDQVHTNVSGADSSEDYWDTYVYNGAGHLVSCSGSGTFSQTDPDTGISTTGTISRSFEVRNGQALLVSQVNSGTTTDMNGKVIGDTSTTTTYGGYQYLGGQWMATSITSVTVSNKRTGIPEHPNAVSTFTRNTSYSFNEYGLMTGMSVSGGGTHEQIGSIGPDGTFGINIYQDTLNATVAYDPEVGYYVSSETTTSTYLRTDVGHTTPPVTTPPAATGGSGTGATGGNTPTATDYIAAVRAMYANLPGYNMNDPATNDYVNFWAGQAAANGGMAYVNTAWNNILGGNQSNGQRNTNWQNNLGNSFSNSGDPNNPTGWAQMGQAAQGGPLYTTP